MNVGKLTQKEQGTLARAIAMNWEEIATGLNISPNHVTMRLHAGHTPLECARELVTQLSNRATPLTELRDVLLTKNRVVYDQNEFLHVPETKMCFQLSSAEQLMLAQKICSFWREIAAYLPVNKIVNENSVCQKFPSEGRLSPSIDVANEFVRQLCQTQLTVDELFSTLKRQNKGGIVTGLLSERPNFLQVTSTSEQNVAAGIEKQQTPISNASGISHSSAFQAEKLKKKKIFTLADAVSEYAARTDLQSLVLALNSPNTDSSHSFGYNCVIDLLKDEYPESVANLKRQWAMTKKENPFANIGLDCLKEMCMLEEFSRMTFTEFLQLLKDEKFAHQPTRYEASRLFTQLSTMEKQEKVNIVNTINCNDELLELFQGVADDLEPVLKFVRTKGGAKTRNDVKLLFQDAKFVDRLDECGVTFMGMRTLKQRLGLLM